jgi:virulence-associated protein VapD
LVLPMLIGFRRVQGSFKNSFRIEQWSDFTSLVKAG